jgi:hypothetical protein
MAVTGAVRTLLVVLMLVAGAAASDAQSIEVVPFGGYRIGSSGASGSAFMPVVYDAGGGVTFGVLVDVPYGPPSDGLKFEALFSRERSWVEVDTRTALNSRARVDVTIDHLMIGGVQELDEAPGRAFLGGLLGLSRFAGPDEVDIRFTIGLSGGAKFFANRHVGLRIEGRGYMTVVSLSGSAACSGGCVAVFNINPAFQADFTAGMIIAF